MTAHDLRHALRTLAKHPGFSFIAILTLALGIGANTAVFSVVNSVLLAPLQFPEPERVITLSTRSTDTGRTTPRITGGDYLDIRTNAAKPFSAISYYYGGEIGVQLSTHSEFTGTFFVEPGFFQVFAIHPLAGRWLAANETNRTVVVSAAFARRNFNSETAALGRTLRLEGRALEIVGIAPDGFHYPRQAHVWTAAPSTPQNLNRTAYNYYAATRLAPGITLAQAQVEIDRLAGTLAQSQSATNRTKTFTVQPLRDQLVGPVRTMLWFLLGAVSLVLLIACANVANLLLARATSRAREFAVRSALGASRWQLLRQVLTESAVLGIAGGLAGAALVWLSIDALVAIAPPNLPRLQEVTISMPVLLFTTLISLSAAIGFGILPALSVSRTDWNSRGAATASSRRSHNLRKALVVSEIALSVTLAIGAGVLFRSLLALQGEPLGYRTDRLLIMQTHAPANGLEGYIQATQRVETILTQLAELPGVRSTAGAMGLPASTYSSNGEYIVEGKHSMAPEAKRPSAGFRLASPGYFSTLGVPLIAGRDFSPRDAYDAPFVAIISQSLARESFPNEDPIGKRMMCGLDSPKWMTIVGIVGDVRQQSPAARPGPELYMPLKQHPFMANELHVLLATAVPPTTLIPSVEARMRELHPEVPTKFTTMDRLVAGSIAQPRFRSMLTLLFAGLALLLAVAGIYGVMNYLVAERKAELGVRIALGARPGAIAALVLRQAGVLAAVGLALGAALSAAASKSLESLVYGVTPTDPTTFAAVAVTVVVVAGIAAWLPARRAAATDPMTVLREQ